MRESRRISIPVIFLSAALALSCASSGPRPQLREVDRSHARMPDWIHATYREEGGTIHVVGERTGAASQEEGEIDARMQATRKLIETRFGLKGSSRYTRMKSVYDTVYEDLLKLQSEGSIRGVRAIDVAWRKYESRRGAGVEYRWDVWVRLAVEQAELEKAVEQAVRGREMAVEQAGEYRDEARRLIDRGDVGTALLRLGIARGRLPAGGGGDPATAVLSTDIQSLIRETIGRLRLFRITAKVPECRIGEGLDRPIQVGVTYGGDAAENVPVAFGFASGAGLVDELVYTDSAGIASARMTRLESAGGPNILEARISHEALSIEDFPSQKVLFSFGTLPPAGSHPGWSDSLRASPPGREVAGEGSSPEGSGPGVSPRFPGGALEVHTALSPVTSRDGRPGEFIVLVEIRAAASAGLDRQQVNIAAVLDKSGSMAEQEKLEHTKESLYFLLDNLTPDDDLSIIAYDSQARTIRAASKVEDRWFPKHQIEAITSGNRTNLSAGLLAGYGQIRRAFRTDAVNRVILLTDGLANTGITDPGQISEFVAHELTRGVSTTTIGVGTSFDADLLMGISEAGGGNYYLVGDPEEIPGVFRQELNSLLGVTAQNVSLAVRSGPGLEVERIYGDHGPYDAREIDLPLGDMSSKEHRILLFRLTLDDRPGQRSEAARRVTFELSYDDVREKGDRVSIPESLPVPGKPGGRGRTIDRDARVDYFYRIAEAFSRLLEYHRTHDQAAYNWAGEFSTKEYPRMIDYARSSEDGCLETILDSYRDCFEMCRAQVEGGMGGEHGMSSKESSRRKTEYFNYLLFDHMDR